MQDIGAQMTITLVYSLLLLFGTATVNASTDGSTSNILNSLCPDGTPRVMTHLQQRREQPFQPDIFTLSCLTSTNDPSKPEFGPNMANTTAYSPILQRRQECKYDCSSYAFCYKRGDPFARDDCTQLTHYIRARNYVQTVEPNQQLLLTSGTCAYRYTNEASTAMTWCDMSWGTQSDIIVEYCLRVMITPSYYGYCSSDGVRLEVYNPATPPSSSSAVVSSTSDATGSEPSITDGSSDSSVSSDSFTSSTSSSTETTTTPTTSTISTTLSVPLPGVSQESEPTTSLESPSTSATPNTGSNGLVNPVTKTNTAMVVGIAVGVCVLLLALVAIWILVRIRRKQRRQQISMLAGEQNTWPGYYSGVRESIQHPMSETLISPSYFAATPWVFPTKMDGELVPRRTLIPAVSAESLMNSVTSSLDADNGTPDPSMSGAASNGTGSLPPTAPMNGTAESAPLLPRQSMSTRMLAQTLAPDLSENDLDRLAQTIVARMHVTVNAPPERGGVDHPGSEVGAQEDLPPPAWRSSWGSNHRPTGPPRR
ncbi:hypothetical protein FRC18_009880 [Serendipita sp. 400]|nr:hypothetical protein FRC18_009880 [Serendipita sp. 400]